MLMLYIVFLVLFILYIMTKQHLIGMIDGLLLILISMYIYYSETTYNLYHQLMIGGNFFIGFLMFVFCTILLAHQVAMNENTEITLLNRDKFRKK